MWHRVDVVLTDASEERIASIFRVEGNIIKSASEETVRTDGSRLNVGNKLSYMRTGPATVASGLRPLSDKTHGGLRLVSGTQPVDATTRTLSGSDVRTPR
jgi:hypothetical protein